MAKTIYQTYANIYTYVLMVIVNNSPLPLSISQLRNKHKKYLISGEWLLFPQAKKVCFFWKIFIAARDQALMSLELIFRQKKRQNGFAKRERTVNFEYEHSSASHIGK
ncbi:MAG: hypothetical protein PHY82_05875 [Lentisphaeria bacterium]|nr:hypothetical protein [Lentisphaeria bacterium]